MFFSDICNFSGISNRLSAEEMLGWIGYVFFVMDHVAEHYYVHKIKTIGDAYFAISGLPGLGPTRDSEPPGSHSLRMLQFASVCAQVFSGKYEHPEAGSCLAAISETSAVLQKEQKRAMAKRRASGTTTSSAATPRHGEALAKRRTSGSTMKSGAHSAGPPRHGDQTEKQLSGHCAMRYGVASGPVTVGVLPGKCPAFDVWGKTVNLASRMEVDFCSVGCAGGVFGSAGSCLGIAASFHVVVFFAFFGAGL